MKGFARAGTESGRMFPHGPAGRVTAARRPQDLNHRFDSGRLQLAKVEGRADAV